MMQYDKVILVTRKTRLEGLIERFNTKEQAQFYIEHGGGDFDFYVREHEVYYAAVSELKKHLRRVTKVQDFEREFLPNFLFDPSDLVIAIGIDGQVVNTAKYLDGQPLIAVNPDPTNIDGILLPFTVASVLPAIETTLRGEYQSRQITMAQVKLNDGQEILAFNDFFIGRQDHISARYEIQAEGEHEDQSSSGILVSTGVGSTGWLSSLFNMANGMYAEFGGDEFVFGRPRMDWESDFLVFVVREPFVSKTSGARIVTGFIKPDKPLLIESHMPDSGVIFSDGVVNDYLEFNSGSIAEINIAEKKTNLVVPSL